MAFGFFSVPLSASGAVDSGPIATNTPGPATYTFQLTGVFNGVTVTFYATNDAATLNGTASNWFMLPAKSVQMGTGVVTNPLFAGNQSMQYEGLALAIRAVSLATAPTGSWNALYSIGVPQ